MSTETIRLIRDGEKGGGGNGRGGGVREIIYLLLHCHHQTPTLRWAAMRAILMFH